MADTAIQDQVPEVQPSQAPGRGAAERARPAGKDQIRQAVRGMGYEEGAKALSPQAAGARDAPAAPGAADTAAAPETGADPKKAAEEKKAAQMATYQDALGRMLGGKAYEVISKETSPEKILGYGSKAVDELIKAATKYAGGAEFLDAASQQAAATAIEKILGDVLKKHAEEYLASDDGKKLAGKLSDWVGTHPWEILAAAIAAAAGAVAANVSIPELKQKVKLGGGFTAEASAKLGKIRDIALEAVSARIAYENGRFKAAVGASRDKEGKVVGTMEASYGDDTNKIYTSGKMDESGVVTGEVGGMFKKDAVSGQAKGTYDQKTGYAGDATIQYAGKDSTIKGGAHVDSSGKYEVRLGQEVQKDLWKYGQTMTYGDQGVGAETSLRYGNDKDYAQMTHTAGPAGEKLSLAGQRTLGATTLAGGYERGSDGTSLATGSAKYTRDDLIAQLNGKFGKAKGADGGLKDVGTVGGSVEYHPSDKWMGKAEAEYSFTDSRFLSYGVQFGFRDPKEFEAFLIEYHRNNAGDVPLDQFKLTVEHTVGNLMLRVQNETTLKAGSLSTGTASAAVAGPINKDWKWIAGASMAYGPDSRKTLTPQLGVQYKDIPVMIGPVINEKGKVDGVSIGITLRFGR